MVPPLVPVTCLPATRRKLSNTPKVPASHGAAIYQRSVTAFRYHGARLSPRHMKSAGLTYQMVSTRPDERISESRVTSGTRSAIAVATIRRSQGSARTVLGIFIVASTTLTVTGSILTASDETRRCFKCGNAVPR